MNGTLYVGVNNIFRRVWEHKMKLVDGFTKQYDCKRLVYCEEFDDVNKAIKREKQLKNWSRIKKENLIKKLNPQWLDLLKEPDISR